MGDLTSATCSTGRPILGRRRVGLWQWGGLGLAFAIGLVAWTLVAREVSAGQPAQSRGGPRLAVDKDLIDFGAVRYNQLVEARFTLKNVGDQPLQLPASPPVEVVEGC
jgi:hypothetical protein